MLLLCFFLMAESLPLDLKQAYWVDPSRGERFDLSGILSLSPELKESFKLEAFDFLLVNDQSSWVYRGLLTEANVLRVEPWLKIGLEWGVRHDFEDIAAEGKSVYILNEGDGSLIEVNASKPPRLIRFPKLKKQLGLTDWFGAEAFAIKDSEFWFFNEKDELRAAVQNASKVLKRSVGRSQTSARFYRGELYLLDRDQRCLWRTPSYEHTGICLDFSRWVDRNDAFRYQVRDSDGKLHPEWTTPEALEVDEANIWIGLDNNGEALYRDATEKRPVLLKFIRPTKELAERP